RDLAAEGPRGPIPLRIYRPAGVPASTPLAALVYFHGGGWVIGDLETHDVLCRQLTAESGASVVSVDYRLAPEHKFPAAADDAWAATRWVVANAARLGVDAARLAVGGDSAGGNLAAVVTLLAREQRAPAIGLQILLYPVTDLAAETKVGPQRFERHRARAPSPDETRARLSDGRRQRIRRHVALPQGDAEHRARDDRDPGARGDAGDDGVVGAEFHDARRHDPGG